jgi:RNA polymerase sigma factor (sigma-70 family)
MAHGKSLLLRRLPQPAFSNLSSKNTQIGDRIMEENKKYQIRINDQLIEVTQEVYLEYYRMGRRERYLEERDLVHGKVLYSQLDDDDTTGEDTVPDRDAEKVEDIVISRIMAARIRECLHLLTESELTLIVMRYYEYRSQSDVAAELGLNQSSVSRREEQILAKLRKLLKK